MIIMICLRGKEWIRHWGPTSVPYPEKDTKIPAIQSRQLHTYGARSDTLQILTHAHNLHRVKPARSKATVCRELPTQNPYITNSIKHDSTMFIWIWYDIASYNTPWTTTGAQPRHRTGVVLFPIGAGDRSLRHDSHWIQLNPVESWTTQRFKMV